MLVMGSTTGKFKDLQWYSIALLLLLKKKIEKKSPMLVLSTVTAIAGSSFSTCHVIYRPRLMKES